MRGVPGRASIAATSASTRPSASPRNKQSASSNRSGEVVHAGPPTTVRRPSRRASARTSCSDGSCTSMPPVSTTSDQRTSSASSGRTFMSTSRMSQSGGNSAATEINPSGGNVARLPIRSRLCWKPQYVVGNSGWTSSARIAHAVAGRMPIVSAACETRPSARGARSAATPGEPNARPVRIRPRRRGRCVRRSASALEAAPPRLLQLANLFLLDANAPGWIRVCPRSQGCSRSPSPAWRGAARYTGLGRATRGSRAQTSGRRRPASRPYRWP